MSHSKYRAILMSCFFHYRTKKKKKCHGTLTGRISPVPLNKHVNRWFNRWESLHLLGQRHDPLCSESAPSCQHSSSGAWDCCPCYKHTKTKCSLGEVGQQSKYATEPRNHLTPVKQIQERFYEATMPAGLDYESGRFWAANWWNFNFWWTILLGSCF